MWTGLLAPVANLLVRPLELRAARGNLCHCAAVLAGRAQQSEPPAHQCCASRDSMLQRLCAAGPGSQACSRPCARGLAADRAVPRSCPAAEAPPPTPPLPTLLATAGGEAASSSSKSQLNPACWPSPADVSLCSLAAYRLRCALEARPATSVLRLSPFLPTRLSSRPVHLTDVKSRHTTAKDW